MIDTSLIGSVMNMSADIYIQQNTQSKTSGTIYREWVYNDTISCKIEPVKTSSGSSRYDNKNFDSGKHNEYHESMQLKMKCHIPISKRWRVSNIRTNDGQKVYVELDKIDQPDTIFDVSSAHAVLDPFGRISYYDVMLKRVNVQSDNTTSE
jgi:hypothetical protein